MTLRVPAPQARLHCHVRALWPGRGVWLPLVFVAWPLLFVLARSARPEHLVVAIGVPLLAYTNATTKRIFQGLLPFGFLALVYDMMRWVRFVGLTTDRVHVCGLRAIDMRLASVVVDGERGTVHDWLQLHQTKALDVLCAIPYGTYLLVAVVFALFLYVKDYGRMRRFGWTFLAVNIAGFVTYHLYPAAPPWYFHAHGCTVDLSAHATEGAALARVDAMMGFGFFHGFYGRSSDVFGAVPSLHASYPMLIVLWGWPVLGWFGRTFSVAFLATMCFGAVYLDHHWIVDVLLGLAYALAGYAIATRLAAESSIPIVLASRSTPEPSGPPSEAATEAAP